MFGLIVSDPSRDAARRKQAEARLDALDLPLTGFTEEASPLFPPDLPCAAFLRTASAALLQPGQPLPLNHLLTYLSTPDPLPANVLRRYLFLQLSLLPYLRPGRPVTMLDGCFLLGDDLLVVPVSADDTVDVTLPGGTWTELNGSCHKGRLRSMRGFNEMPVLVRENVLLPIGVNDRSIHHDDADRLTLHWFQPEEAAECVLADGTGYRALHRDGHFTVQTDTVKPFHLIVHRDGAEYLIR